MIWMNFYQRDYVLKQILVVCNNLTACQSVKGYHIPRSFGTTYFVWSYLLFLSSCYFFWIRFIFKQTNWPIDESLTSVVPVKVSSMGQLVLVHGETGRKRNEIVSPLSRSPNTGVASSDAVYCHKQNTAIFWQSLFPSAGTQLAYSITCRQVKYWLFTFVWYKYVGIMALDICMHNTYTHTHIYIYIYIYIYIS